MRNVAITLGLVWVAAVGACANDEIKVREVDESDPGDYGRTELLAAVGEANKGEGSPRSYRRFAAKVEQLRSHFSDDVADEAELQLAFMALAPMDAVVEQSPEAQLAILATTVWPTAFRVAPEPGESADAYLLRICAAKLRGTCGRLVPEAWPIVLGAYAWSHFHARARDAHLGCTSCPGHAGYLKALKTYAARDRAIGALASKAASDAKTRRWPSAGEHAAPWTEPPVFARSSSGKGTFRGAKIPAGGWREALAENRGDADVLGVYLRPKDKVRILQVVVADAGAAGFREVALMARDAAYPFAKREYRIATDPKAKVGQVRVRSSDTIQVLVQALDTTLGDDGGALKL